MKKIFSFLSFFMSLHLGLFLHSSVCGAPRMLVVNTQQEDAHVFHKTFGQLASSEGTVPTIYSLAQALDASLEELSPQNYKILCLIANTEFLMDITKQEKSPATKKILSIIKRFQLTQGAVICYFLPYSSLVKSLFKVMQGPLTLTGVLSPLFNPSAYEDPRQAQEFSAILNTFLSAPPISGSRSLPYHTTLMAPRAGMSFQAVLHTSRAKKISYPVISQKNAAASLAFLPLLQNGLDKRIQEVLPLALYSYQPASKNHLVVSFSDFTNVSGTSENIKLLPCDPVNPTLHQAFLKAWQQTLHEIGLIAQQPSDIPGIFLPGIATQRLPSFAHKNHPLTIPQPSSADTALPAKVAWMEIGDNREAAGNKIFFGTSPREKEQQNRLIEYILMANLDALWIRFNPQELFSSSGRFKNEKNAFMRNFGIFTKALKTAAAQQKKPIPRIWVGIEISNNYEQRTVRPADAAVDIYGTVYPSCPRPLDLNFWNGEVVSPLARFVEEWKKDEISNGIPLSGVVLDLEMYHSSPGEFSSVMGFEKKSIDGFLGASYQGNVHSFVQNLIKSRQAGNYFSYLQKNAYNLGTYLRKALRNIIPQATLGIYAPTISLNWFYKKLYEGMSLPHSPLLFFSFLSEFNSHKKWFWQNNMYLEHSSVLLLSKIKHTSDSNQWLNHIFNHHGHLWINRFNRLVQPYKPQEWYGNEQTPLNHRHTKEFLKELSHIKPYS